MYIGISSPSYSGLYGQACIYPDAQCSGFWWWRDAIYSSSITPTSSILSLTPFPGREMSSVGDVTLIGGSSGQAGRKTNVWDNAQGFVCVYLYGWNVCSWYKETQSLIIIDL